MHLYNLKELKIRLLQITALKFDTVCPQEQYLIYSSFLEGNKNAYQIGLCYKFFSNDCGSESWEPMLLYLSSGWPWWQDFLFLRFHSESLLWFLCFQQKLLREFQRQHCIHLQSNKSSRTHMKRLDFKSYFCIVLELTNL